MIYYRSRTSADTKIKTPFQKPLRNNLESHPPHLQCSLLITWRIQTHFKNNIPGWTAVFFGRVINLIKKCSDTLNRIKGQLQNLQKALAIGYHITSSDEVSLRPVIEHLYT